jgi:hypothetical protein
MFKFLDLFKSVGDLSTSRRVVVAVLGFLAPIISEKFGVTLTPDQINQLTVLVVGIIAALTVRDHNPEPVVEPKK